MYCISYLLESYVVLFGEAFEVIVLIDISEVPKDGELILESYDSILTKAFVPAVRIRLALLRQYYSAKQ